MSGPCIGVSWACRQNVVGHLEGFPALVVLGVVRCWSESCRIFPCECMRGQQSDASGKDRARVSGQALDEGWYLPIRGKSEFEVGRLKPPGGAPLVLPLGDCINFCECSEIVFGGVGWGIVGVVPRVSGPLHCGCFGSGEGLEAFARRGPADGDSKVVIRVQDILECLCEVGDVRFLVGCVSVQALCW